MLVRRCSRSTISIGHDVLPLRYDLEERHFVMKMIHGTPGIRLAPW